jgi:hypothetical protein
VIVRRWQEFSGGAATLDRDGRTYDGIAAEREAVYPRLDQTRSLKRLL